MLSRVSPFPRRPCAAVNTPPNTRTQGRKRSRSLVVMHRLQEVVPAADIRHNRLLASDGIKQIEPIDNISRCHSPCLRRTLRRLTRNTIRRKHRTNRHNRQRDHQHCFFHIHSKYKNARETQGFYLVSRGRCLLREMTLKFIEHAPCPTPNYISTRRILKEEIISLAFSGYRSHNRCSILISTRRASSFGTRSTSRRLITLMSCLWFILKFNIALAEVTADAIPQIFHFLDRHPSLSRVCRAFNAPFLAVLYQASHYPTVCDFRLFELCDTKCCGVADVYRINILLCSVCRIS